MNTVVCEIHCEEDVVQSWRIPVILEGIILDQDFGVLLDRTLNVSVLYSQRYMRIDPDNVHKVVISHCDVAVIQSVYQSLVATYVDSC